SEEVNRADAEGHFTLAPSNPGGSFGWNGTTHAMIFTPAAPLASGTTYTYAVGNVRDLSGNVMAGTYQASFATEGALPVETIYRESFDGASTWRHTAKFGTDDWQIGAPHASTFDPGTAPSGPNVAGNTLGGNYPNGSHNYIESPG